MGIRILVLFTALLISCAKKEGPKPPFVQEMRQQENVLVKAFPPAISTEVTLRKESVLGQTFLYGSTLQFSSIQEEEGDDKTNLMAIALGQFPAEFRIVDQTLRLVSDSSMAQESEISAPSRLIQEFPIIRQDSNTVTIRADKASPVLETFLFGEKTKLTKRASWIRSMEFAEGDDLFLIESSLEMSDGSVAEFMETLTPRSRVVPEGFKPIYADPELNEAASRYRFLDAGKVFLNHPEEGRVQTSAAQRFLRKNGEPIRWYVTANIPDEYYNDVKNGLEAWNRYTRAAGLPDLIRFEGKLPEGVKIGDPRYNILVWDQVESAGSAYESQSSDPLTGIQTHSLIYLPYAWVNVGRDYWENGQLTELRNEKRMNRLNRLLKGRKFMNRRLPVNCIEGAHMHLAANALENPEEFGRALLKSVVFHESGHALGLAHNFKGSMAFDPEQENPHFSHSIMDYNLYNEEAAAFFSLDSADGPLLEYDRQILSVLYNEGKDVKETDPVLPVCSDKEAESKAGGIDPLCLQYDIGTDPTLQAIKAFQLLGNETIRNGRMASLPATLARLSGRLPDAGSVSEAEQAKKALEALLKQAQGVTSIYIGTSGNSLAFQGAQALKSLYVFRPGSIPEGYQEVVMRERALSLLELISGMITLPEPASRKLQALKADAIAWLERTPFFLQQPEEERKKLLTSYSESFETTFKSLESSQLSRVRTRFASALKYSADAPLSFHLRDGAAVDVELLVIERLETLAGPLGEGKERPLAERTAAAASLKTFQKIEAAKEAAARLRESLKSEIQQAQDARKRELLRKLAEELAW